MLRSIVWGLLIAAILIIASCNKENNNANSGAKLIFKYKFDSTQVRLDSIGNPKPFVQGAHAALNPIFNSMSAHYIELAQNGSVGLGKGAVLYLAPQVIHGSDTAIDYSQETFAKDGEVFFSKPLKEITAGSYQWLRVSLAYQNFDVSYRVDTTIPVVYGGTTYQIPINQDFPATVAGFIGFNTFINSFNVKTRSVTVNGSKKQGYWGFESPISINYMGYNYKDTTTITGQSAGVTTVVNPIFATSPIPAGSCVVTAQFSPSNLTITGNETKDIVVTVSLSTNKSFEWEDGNRNGKWDAWKGEKVVDMGIRGMIPTFQ